MSRRARSAVSTPAPEMRVVGEANEAEIRRSYEEALARAGRLIARRARACAEVRDGLASWGCEPAVAARVVQRLEELRLLDDRAFAEQWIEERSRRGRAGNALVAELVGKGVDREVARAALVEADLDEAAQARALVAKHVARVAGLDEPKQAARLLGLLQRRGFDREAAVDAVRSVLPPEDWD